MHITTNLVNIIVYLSVCIYFEDIVNMCLNNNLHSEERSSSRNLIKSLNMEISNKSESYEYLEVDSNWPIETNVRGLCSKTDQIKRLVDTNPCNKPPEVIESIHIHIQL